MNLRAALLFFCNAMIFGMAGGLLSLLPGFARAMDDPTADYLLLFALAWMAAGVTLTALYHRAWNPLRTWIGVGLIGAPGVALMGRYDGPAVLALWTATVCVAWGVMAVLLQARTRRTLWASAPWRRAGMVAAIALGMPAGGAIGRAAATVVDYAMLFDLLALLWLGLVGAGILALEKAGRAQQLQVVLHNARKP